MDNAQYDIESQVRIFRLLVTDSDQEPTSNELLIHFLDVACELILNRRYPFSLPENAILDKKYYKRQIAIAVELYNKMGAEGETAHSESGVQRVYSDDAVTKQLLSDIVPVVGTV